MQWQGAHRPNSASSDTLSFLVAGWCGQTGEECLGYFWDTYASRLTLHSSIVSRKAERRWTDEVETPKVRLYSHCLISLATKGQRPQSVRHVLSTCYLYIYCCIQIYDMLVAQWEGWGTNDLRWSFRHVQYWISYEGVNKVLNSSRVSAQMAQVWKTNCSQSNAAEALAHDFMVI